MLELWHCLRVHLAGNSAGLYHDVDDGSPHLRLRRGAAHGCGRRHLHRTVELLPAHLPLVCRRHPPGVHRRFSRCSGREVQRRRQDLVHRRCGPRREVRPWVPLQGGAALRRTGLAGEVLGRPTCGGGARRRRIGQPDHRLGERLDRCQCHRFRKVRRVPVAGTRRLLGRGHRLLRLAPELLVLPEGRAAGSCRHGLARHDRGRREG
mmetsp:Transcript_90758/g.253550  ORF Transcript_90758/g.253550 Transcript_90758/m.253550 type:complete len:207 (+) Transcript_90758:1226-1846(+)